MREQTQKEFERVKHDLFEKAEFIGGLAMFVRLEFVRQAIDGLSDTHGRELSTLRAEQTRLREALRDCVEAMEAMIGKREAGFAIEEIIDAGHAALSSTPTPETTP